MGKQIQEITRDEWHPFFDAFSGMHRGWPVTVEVREGPREVEVKLAEVPLEEIAAELGSETGRISVVLRPSTDSEINHVIEAPTHVWLEGGDMGPEVALAITSAGGTVTCIRLNQLELPRPEPELFA